MELRQQQNATADIPGKATSRVQWVTPPSLRKPNRPYRVQCEFKSLERQQRVTSVLNSGEFRNELENILQGQLAGRKPPRPTKALQTPHENVFPASQVGGSWGLDQQRSSTPGAVVPINDLRGANATIYTLAERRLRCKLASLCRLAHMFGWESLIYTHLTVSWSLQDTVLTCVNWLYLNKSCTWWYSVLTWDETLLFLPPSESSLCVYNTTCMHTYMYTWPLALYNLPYTHTLCAQIGTSIHQGITLPGEPLWFDASWGNCL